MSATMQSTFNIMDELSAWGKTLPSWQSFLLSKLVTEVDLPDKVIDEIFAEYLIDQNLASSGANRMVCNMTLPQFQVNEPTVISTLTAISSVSGSCIQNVDIGVKYNFL